MNAKESILEAYHIIKRINSERNILLVKRTEINDLRNDILHEIELKRLSAPEMVKKYNELKKVLQIRREIKDEIDEYDLIKNKIKIKNFDDLFSDFGNLAKKKANRKYHKRSPSKIRKQILKDGFVK